MMCRWLRQFFRNEPKSQDRPTEDEARAFADIASETYRNVADMRHHTEELDALLHDLADKPKDE